MKLRVCILRSEEGRETRMQEWNVFTRRLLTKRQENCEVKLSLLGTRTLQICCIHQMQSARKLCPFVNLIHKETHGGAPCEEANAANIPLSRPPPKSVGRHSQELQPPTGITFLLLLSHPAASRLGAHRRRYLRVAFLSFRVTRLLL